MDTSRLKRFATEARNILMQGVTHRLQSLGFQVDGKPIEEPKRFEGGATFLGETVSLDFYEKWQSLARAIREHKRNVVIEEAAYTWFNRLMAIRIMVKNHLIPPVLQYESEGVRVPLIVTEARQGRIPDMREEEQRKLMELLDDDSKTAEQFSILIVAFCHDTPIINACFGHITDYTELLLPANILTEGGFVDLINHTDFIADEDYKSPELIGWLYQFYISEKKDDVFASFKKGKKAEAEDIPAATQIFTPNWIVKYMVQNTIGRIYLDNNPYEEDIQKNWPYLVEQPEPTPDDKILHYEDLKELKFADLACGSGHILNEGFNILYDLYILEGYSRKDAIESIFRYNLTGVDIDTRAKQMAQFALLLRACQKDATFVDAHIMPRILDMPDPYPYKVSLRETLSHFFISGNQSMIQEVINAIDLMDQAKNLGSIMKFNISEQTRNTIAGRMEVYNQQDFVPENIRPLMPYMQIILSLTERYVSLIANPPYMGRGNMNNVLSLYLDKNYPTAKQDLYSCFMQMMIQKTITNGRTGFITMESWMFLPTFEKFRNYIIDNIYISSLSHFGWHIIGIAFGTVMTIIVKSSPQNKKGVYSYLSISDIDKEKNIPYTFPKKDNGRYACIQQNQFKKIPGSPIDYWVNSHVLELFQHPSFDTVGDSKQGLATSNNNMFVRQWYEVSYNHTSICINPERKKWFPYNKGGAKRRWYGNQECIVNWEDGGKDIYAYKGAVIRNPSYYFKSSLSWGLITAATNSFRYYPKGFIFDVGGMSYFPFPNVDKYVILGILNTKFYADVAKLINPTVNLQCGDVAKFPYLPIEDPSFKDKVKDNVSISKSDWDAHETSWYFQTNELLTMDEQVLIDNVNYIVQKQQKESGDCISVASSVPHPESVEWCYNTYCTKWERLFMQLYGNEEELNRQFIEIYGLKDELSPDISMDEITILQQGEISIKDNTLFWHPDVVMKQLISYAVGCMMGRYSIDKPGLILANHGDGIEQYNDLVPNSRFEVDDDGIVPLMSAQSDFADNATVRFKHWLSVTFGEETLVENLNFIEASLGKSIDDYFVKDFWKDHKKMYQNRPIYWLFSSKKGAFQCIAYMHRMDAYTAERIRTKYLLPHIEWLLQKQSEMEADAVILSAKELKQLDNIIKQISECREYHDRLHVIADQQIAFDLDDGVIVNYAKFGDVLAKIK